jgi:transcriptional regulator
LRHEILSLLGEDSLSAREISERVGIRESEVLEHLEHIKIALHGRLAITPAFCMECDFSFAKRERLKGPGRCPICRSEHIAEPRFSVDQRFLAPR